MRGGHVFPSSGILSLEADWMTQMLVGFGSRYAPGTQLLPSGQVPEL